MADLPTFATFAAENMFSRAEAATLYLLHPTGRSQCDYRPRENAPHGSAENHVTVACGLQNFR